LRYPLGRSPFPLFFIICAEALSNMLNHSVGMGKIFGVPIC